MLYHLNHISTIFAFRYFLHRVLHLCPGRPKPWFSDLCFLPTEDDRCASSHPGFLLVDMGVSWTSCPSWLKSLILPVSASLVVGVQPAPSLPAAACIFQSTLIFLWSTGLSQHTMFWFKSVHKLGIQSQTTCTKLFAIKI
jgi:hypothetical protein